MRNVGTWAGNLMTFLQYSTFPSDAVLALTTAHVTLQCCDRNGELSTMSIDEFITTDYNEFVYTKGMFLVSLIMTESKTPSGAPT